MAPDLTDRPGSRGVGEPSRVRAAFGALRALHEAQRARSEERRALARLGRALAALPNALDALAQAREAVRAVQRDVDAADVAISRSLEEDRADYGRASSWARPAVIVRGLMTRAVVRDRRRGLRRARTSAWARLGAAALDGCAAPVLVDVALADAGVATALADAQDARSRAQASASDAERRLARWGGGRGPEALRHVGREVGAFGAVLLREVRGSVVPRVPALAGLLVGWWVATTFTDSPFSAWLHGLGIGRGPRRAVSSDTYRAMAFWLPVCAAALCSYAGGRLGALVRARYGAPRESSPDVVTTRAVATSRERTDRDGPDSW